MLKSLACMLTVSFESMQAMKIVVFLIVFIFYCTSINVLYTG